MCHGVIWLVEHSSFLLFTGPDDKRTVIVKSISLVVEGRPDVTLDLTGLSDQMSMK